MSIPSFDEILERAQLNQAPDKSPFEPLPGEWFLAGPIPGGRLQQAAKLPGRALHAWLTVLWAYQQKGRLYGVKVTNRDLDQFGVLEDAGRRALAALEQAGLIEVNRHSGCSPWVKVIATSAADAALEDTAPDSTGAQ